MKIKMDDIAQVEKTGGLFKVSWKMTSWCNYRCPYCYMSKEVAKGNNHTPVEKVYEIADNIDRLVADQRKGRELQLHYIGGEVGYYDLVEVTKRIKTPIKQIICATNFSNKLDYWERFGRYCASRNTKLTVIASFHLSQCNRDEFVDKLIYIKKNFPFMNARAKCVVNQENIPIYKPYFEKLNENNVTVEVTVERGIGNACIELSKENQEYVDLCNKRMNEKKNHAYFNVYMKDGNQIKFGSNIEFIDSIEGGGYDPDGFVCTAGSDGIRLAQDGSVRWAGCRWASLPQHRLGFITDPDITDKLPKAPIRCSTYGDDGSGILVHKMCTCFSNASMWRDAKTEEIHADHLKKAEIAKAAGKFVEVAKGEHAPDPDRDVKGHISELDEQSDKNCL